MYHSDRVEWPAHVHEGVVVQYVRVSFVLAHGERPEVQQ